MSDAVRHDADDAHATSARPGRKRDHSRDPEILQAALDVLGEYGYDGMTIEMVAARAKAGKATLYRRWSSKGELVLDAITCMKRGDTELPDTGSLRGDLIALIRAPALEDADRKSRIMGGVLSIITREPDLAKAVRAAIVEPRIHVNRQLMERARDRGEVSPDADIESAAWVSSTLAAQRVLIDGRPATRDFLVGMIDGIVLPALGVRADASR